MSVHKICPKCQQPAEMQAAQCVRCGRAFRTTAPMEPPTQVYPASNQATAVPPPPQTMDYTPQPPRVDASLPGKLIGILVIGGLVIGLQSMRPQIFGTTLPTTAAPTGLRVESARWGYADGSRCVEGVVINHTKKRLDYASINYPLFDSSGAQVGSALANINQLEVGAHWKFQAPVFESAATKFGTPALTGF